MQYKSITVGCCLMAIVHLSGCGEANYSRVNNKQNTSSDVKISQLDLKQKSISLRFDYRSYLDKTLKQVDCTVEFNSAAASLSVTQSPALKLDPFSTEILNFSPFISANIESLQHLATLDYVLACTLDYDKNTEYVEKKSVLHLVPASQFSYR